MILEEKVQLQISNTPYKSSPNLPFPSLIRYLTLGRVLHLLTLYITNVSSEKELRHFLIYCYITARHRCQNWCVVKGFASRRWDSNRGSCRQHSHCCKRANHCVTTFVDLERVVYIDEDKMLIVARDVVINIRYFSSHFDVV